MLLLLPALRYKIEIGTSFMLLFPPSPLGGTGVYYYRVDTNQRRSGPCFNVNQEYRDP